MIVVDTEADPEYRFAGLANLVRKARVDFGAEIKFLTKDELEQDDVESRLPSCARFGTVKMMRKRGAAATKGSTRGSAGRKGDEGPVESTGGGSSSAHAALARVSYSDRDEYQSLLVYLKAAVVGGEPVDVEGYKALHPAFPQETTADQFFDEAQWESYRMLGEFVGKRVFGGGLKSFLELTGASEF